MSRTTGLSNPAPRNGKVMDSGTLLLGPEGIESVIVYIFRRCNCSDVSMSKTLRLSKPSSVILTRLDFGHD
jgi:hypothetical protein